MLPWFKLLPHNKILAPFRTNETVGLLLLISGFTFYFAIGRPLAGGLAALLLATQPASLPSAGHRISDLSGAVAIVLAFALVYSGISRMRRWPIYCAAIVLGLSLCIRPQLVFFAPLLIAMALFPANVSWTRWFIALLPCPCGIRRGREPVLYSEHFRAWPSVKDWIRILGTGVGGQASCFFLPQCPSPSWHDLV